MCETLVNNMENLMACRICLATDVKLYDMYKYCLENAYENLTGLNMGLPSCLRHVCGYCGALLNKFTLFRNKCTRSQLILEHLLGEHIMITTHHIKSINRNVNNLSLPYTTHAVHNFDSTVLIKEEIYERNINPPDHGTAEIHTPRENTLHSIKPDTNIDFDYNYDSYINNESKLETDDEIKNSEDSDEEPLSKKAKKRKRKIKSSNKREKVKLEVCDTIDDVKRRTPKNQFVDIEQEIEHKLVILTKEEQRQEVLLRKSSANYQNSVYKCDNCYKGFMTEVTYKNHLARHHERCGPEVCSVCNTRWSDARALRAHALISHERKYICQVCGSTCKSPHAAREHAAWHRGAVYCCQRCGLAFKRSTSYLTHVRLRHGSHACSDCGARFIGRHGLNLHRKKAHALDGERSPVVQHECDSCHFQFDNKEALTRHAELGCDDKLRPCLLCGAHFPPPLLDAHLEEHQKANAIRTCHQCARPFPHERALAAHAARAHGGGALRARAACAHVCEVCGYKCTTRAALVSHQRTHTGEKPFPCAACGKRFSVYQRLQIHLRTHTGERPFRCTRCPKAFKHKAALNRHDRVHTGAKPYTCPQCGKSFSQSNSMKQHCAGVHMKMYIYSRRAANKQTN